MLFFMLIRIGLVPVLVSQNTAFDFEGGREISESNHYYMYRKLAISYDRLEEIRLGSRNLAYAMINFRVTFNSS